MGKTQCFIVRGPEPQKQWKICDLNRTKWNFHKIQTVFGVRRKIKIFAPSIFDCQKSRIATPHHPTKSQIFPPAPQGITGKKPSGPNLLSERKTTKTKNRKYPHGAEQLDETNILLKEEKEAETWKLRPKKSAKKKQNFRRTPARQRDLQPPVFVQEIGGATNS